MKRDERTKIFDVILKKVEGDMGTATVLSSTVADLPVGPFRVAMIVDPVDWVTELVNDIEVALADTARPLPSNLLDVEGG